MGTQPFTYAQAGVNIAANDEMVERIRASMQRTYGPRVLDAHGSFAGLLRLDYDEKLFKKNYRQPVLVGCTDGVGTKVLVAVQLRRFDTIGIDLVAMNVNDLITVGAEPLFFLDYVALHRLDPEFVATVVDGISTGCREAGCALLGGETAEMPDLYARDHFDLAGFSVGVVERDRLIDFRRVEPDDVLLGLASTGLHANGYALARKLVFEVAGMSATQDVPELGTTLGEELLRPTRIYVRPILSVLRRYRRKHVVSAMAHITGGGLPGNVRRILPPDCDAVIKCRSWTVPPIFNLLQGIGVELQEMFRVFNMGIGFVLAVRRPFADSIAGQLRRLKQKVCRLGYIKRGSGVVELRP